MTTKTMIAVIGALSATFLASQAFAAALTNRDVDEYSLQIQDHQALEGLDSDGQMPGPRTVKVKGNESVKGLCGMPCTVRLPNGAEIDLDYDDVVTIERGQIKKN